jgi:allene oxide cyclase
MRREFSVMILLACAISPAYSKERLQFVEHGSSENLLDLGTKGDSAGDVFTYENPIFDSTDKTQLGVSHGFCIRIVAKISWECSATLVLQSGQITLAGVYTDSKDSLFAVTGGTGKYAGAKGEVHLHTVDAKAQIFSLVYELL